MRTQREVVGHLKVGLYRSLQKIHPDELTENEVELLFLLAKDEYIQKALRHFDVV